MANHISLTECVCQTIKIIFLNIPGLAQLAVVIESLIKKGNEQKA